VTGIEAAVAAIREGRLAVIPTDTVYGLACRPDDEGAVQALSALKGRSPEQPVALVAGNVEALLELVPELRPHEPVLRGLLPGPYTLVLPNPAHRLAWLSGSRPETIGVRTPSLDGLARELLDKLGVVAATSANLHGSPDARRVEELAPQIRDACVVVDGGVLPGVPSTVLDLTGWEPRVLREGAVTAPEALARAAAVLDREPMP
jgi:L-threonylcarbamoyladenylate synthase